MPIIDLLEIISLGFGLLAVGAHLSLFAVLPFVECSKEFVLLLGLRTIPVVTGTTAGSYG